MSPIDVFLAEAPRLSAGLPGGARGLAAEDPSDMCLLGGGPSSRVTRSKEEEGFPCGVQGSRKMHGSAVLPPSLCQSSAGPTQPEEPRGSEGQSSLEEGLLLAGVSRSRTDRSCWRQRRRGWRYKPTTLELVLEAPL